MRMQSATIFLVKVLSCVLLLCLCSSAPPKREGKEPASSRRHPFTKQEDEFIINELSSSTINALRTGDMKRWKEMSRKIHQLHSGGKRGFPQDRTEDSIRNHFWNILMKDKSSYVLVPPELKQAIRESRANLPKGNEMGSAQGSGYSFTQQEDELIINELLSNIANRPIYGYASKGWTSISRKFHELHSAGKPGFLQDRSDDSIRVHFMNILMKDKSPYVKIPPDLKQAIRESRAKLLAEKEQAGSPANCPFTQEEDELIINELSSIITGSGGGHVPIPKGWNQISQRIHELYSAGKPGFPQNRSDDSIRSHFVSILMKDKSPYVKVPPELKHRFYEARARLAGTSSTSNPQNQQADPQMINKEDDQYWADMIEALCAEPGDLDFSLLGDMDDQ